MFARLTPFILALLAIVSTATDSDCHTVCCTQSNLAPSGWQGTGCTSIAADGACAHTKFCCYTIVEDGAAKCTWPEIDVDERFKFLVAPLPMAQHCNSKPEGNVELDVMVALSDLVLV
ncbi:hypothetical protein PAXINDRAFT_7657 [Paxillus involutus ATCC 200175]|nr:hypothetical protein PAXINDRAFT_7657 [Paxillus involutus ATCC 200175]